MTDPATFPTGAASPEAPKKSGMIALVAIVVAGIAGVAVFSDNLNKIADNGHKLCQYAHLCAADPPPALPLPTLAGYDSPAMAGGHSQPEQCGPLLEKYKAENPQFNITVKSGEDSNKDFWGHVTYHYHCHYVATPK